MSILRCAAAILLAAGSTQGALIYEPFDYPAGADLTGQTPNGGANTWQVMGTAGGASGTDPITIASGSLSGVTGLAPAIGNSITFGGLGLTNRIPIGSPFTTGTLYYSFAFKVTDLGSLSATGGFMAGFNNSTGNATNQPTAIATRVVTKLSGSGFQVGVDKTLGQAGSFVFDDTVRDVGETIFVVGSYTFNSGSTTDDESRLWIDPDPSTFGLDIAPTGFLSSVATNDFTQIASFLFRQGNAAAVPGVVVADELRVDTTWAGVTVPEPSASIGLVLAGMAMLSCRRRGRR